MMRFDMLRVFDILLAIVIGIVTLPIQAFVLALVWLAYGRNPIFVQERVGLYGKLFWLYKIKTMRDSAVDDDSKRVTLIGRYLRRSSIDELPQILNVLLGDMSFVGPRPLTREILDNIQVSAATKLLRQQVRPGLTGLSQVMSKGMKRSQVDKFAFDVKWVRNKSIGLYLKICLKTLKVLVVRYRNNKDAGSL